MNQKSRAFRNNNPGNLRWVEGINWQGQTGRDSAGYATFDNMTNGVRALAIDLTNAIRKGYDTPRKLIEHYAPTNENPTEAYVKFVSAFMSGRKDPNYHLSADDIERGDVERLTDVIARFECGEWISPEFLIHGLAAAAAHFLQQQKHQENSLEQDR